MKLTFHLKKYLTMGKVMTYVESKLNRTLRSWNREPLFQS